MSRDTWVELGLLFLLLGMIFIHMFTFTPCNCQNQRSSACQCASCECQLCECAEDANTFNPDSIQPTMGN